MFANLRNALYKLFPEDCQNCYQKSQADFANYPTIATGSLAVVPPFEPTLPNIFRISAQGNDTNTTGAATTGITFTAELDTELTLILPNLFSPSAPLMTALQMRQGADVNGAVLYTSDEVEVIPLGTETSFNVEGSPIIQEGDTITLTFTNAADLFIQVQDNNLDEVDDFGIVQGTTTSPVDPILSVIGYRADAPPPVPFSLSVPNIGTNQTTLAANSIVFTPAEDVQLSDLSILTTTANILNPPFTGITILPGAVISGIPIFTSPQVQVQIGAFTDFDLTGSPVLQAGQQYSIALTNQSGQSGFVSGFDTVPELGTFNGLLSTSSDFVITMNGVLV